MAPCISRVAGLLAAQALFGLKALAALTAVFRQRDFHLPGVSFTADFLRAGKRQFFGNRFRVASPAVGRLKTSRAEDTACGKQGAVEESCGYYCLDIGVEMCGVKSGKGGCFGACAVVPAGMQIGRASCRERV